MSLCRNFKYLPSDITFYMYSFLSYKESTFLQKSSKILKLHQIQMNKYCQHIHPHGKIKLYNKTKIIQEENYKEGKKEGIQKYWYKNVSNKQLHIKENYKKGVRNGILKMWYDNGQLHFKYKFKNGEKIKEEFYSKEGQLLIKLNFKNEKQEGIQTYWRENGNLWYQFNYKNGKKCKIQKEWYENEKLKSEENYYAGKKCGIQKYYSINETLKKWLFIKQ